MQDTHRMTWWRQVHVFHQQELLYKRLLDSKTYVKRWLKKCHTEFGEFWETISCIDHDRLWTDRDKPLVSTHRGSSIYHVQKVSLMTWSYHVAVFFLRKEVTDVDGLPVIIDSQKYQIIFKMTRSNQTKLERRGKKVLDFLSKTLRKKHWLSILRSQLQHRWAIDFCK